jgi:superoxide dismutase, Cu-Zn family
MVMEVINMYLQYNQAGVLFGILRNRPDASADIKGSGEYPDINGKAYFYQTKEGVYVITSVIGLPGGMGKCDNRIFAMHIHEGGSCTGNLSGPFADSGTHFNPDNCSHPEHAGDLPPLFGNNGYAWSGVLTNRFRVNEIIGKTVIIHAMPDDFRTQPSGNAGRKIACGVIRR